MAHTATRARGDLHCFLPNWELCSWLVSVTCSFGGPEQHFFLHILTLELLPKTFPSLPRGPTSTRAFNTTDLALYRREVNFSLTSKSDLNTLSRAKSICPFWDVEGRRKRNGHAGTAAAPYNCSSYIKIGPGEGGPRTGAYSHTHTGSAVTCTSDQRQRSLVSTSVLSQATPLLKSCMMPTPHLEHELWVNSICR